MSVFWESLRKEKPKYDAGIGGSKLPRKMDPKSFGAELGANVRGDNGSFLRDTGTGMKLAPGKWDEYDPDTFNARTEHQQSQLKKQYAIGQTPTEDLRARGGAYAGAIEESVGAPSAVGAIKASKQGDYRAQMYANHQNEITDREKAKERAKEEAKIRATNAFQTQRSDNDPASRYEYRY